MNADDRGRARSWRRARSAASTASPSAPVAPPARAGRGWPSRRTGGFQLGFAGDGFTRGEPGAARARTTCRTRWRRRCSPATPASAGTPVQAGLDAYPGLPHRLESVRALDGVEWINDSKATNVDAVLVALAAFRRAALWLIAGGKGKGAPYAPLVERVGAGQGEGRAHRSAQDADRASRGVPAGAAAACTPARRSSAAVEQRARSWRGRATRCCSRRPARRTTSSSNFEHRGDTFKRAGGGAAVERHERTRRRARSRRAVGAGAALGTTRCCSAPCWRSSRSGW